MKTMKSLVIGLALLVGMVSLSHASRSGAGWRPYTVTASSAQIFVGNGFFNSMMLSSGCTLGDYTVGFDTVSGNGITGFIAYVSTNAPQVTPSIQFSTATVPVFAGGTPSNAYWSPGQAEGDYVEITNGLFIWKNTASLGNCDTVTVYYSR